MKKIIAATALVASLVVPPLPGAMAAADAAKLGYVDLQKVLNSSNSGRGAKELLAEKVKKYQDEINRKQEELKKLKDVLEKQSVVLSEKARGEKEKEYQQNLKEFQRLTKDAQEELQAKDEELTRGILGEIEKVVHEYGRRNGYIFIFIRNESMIYADDKADVTDDILKIFNGEKK